MPTGGSATGLTTGQLFGLGGISAITTFGETFSAVTDQRINSEFKERQARINRDAAEFAAENVIKQGERDVARLRRRTRKLESDQRVALAAQGIDIESGSALDVLEDTAGSAASDIMTIKNNARRQAFGFKSQALNFGEKAAFESIAAKARRVSTIATGGARFVRDIGGLAFSGNRRVPNRRSARQRVNLQRSRARSDFGVIE